MNLFETNSNTSLLGNLSNFASNIDVSIDYIQNNTTNSNQTNSQQENATEGENNDNNTNTNNDNPDPRNNQSTFSLEQLDPNWFSANAAFIFLLVLYFLFIHIEGIFFFIWTTYALLSSNSVITTHVASTEKKYSSLVSNLFSNIIFVNILMFFIFKEEKFYKDLIFISDIDTSITIWSLLFHVLMADSIARFITMSIKTLLIITLELMPILKDIPLKRKRHCYAILELFSQIYRSLIPVRFWFYFFLSDAALYNCLIASAYITLKILSVSDSVMHLYSVIQSFWSKALPFDGNYATTEQLALTTEDPTCSICQDNFQTPVALPCNHIFCEECICHWFEKKDTCPVCRASVRKTTSRSFSDGSTTIFSQLF